LVRQVFDVRHLRHVQHYAVPGSGLQLLNSYAAAKKDKQRKRLTPLILKRVPRAVAVVVHLESVFSHIRRE
ncbi:hypothetical protein, partial [Paraburkholderia solitsugae]|uniref:hypothetical protein n=1 Tax=Paraburkholderia solitsugae TaxID=2675748 RepID=UPI001C12DA0A